MKEFYNKYFMKQKMMHPVMFALLPIILVSCYFYGWRVLLLLFVNILAACIVEYISNYKIYGRKKISEAVVVTSILYTLTLPVSIQVWISIVGILFGVFFGKMVFGGFGKNIFNPALVGRVFIYVNFPQQMTVFWNEAGRGFPGGLGTFVTKSLDAMTQPTPMSAFKLNGDIPNYQDMLFGQIPGVIGETSKILIILAAVYLVYKKVASWQIMLGSIIGFSGLTLAFNFIGVTSVPNPIVGMLMGGFLFGTVFMATDPVSAAKTVPGKWIYGIIIGLVTVVIRGFALFAGGVMFAVLIGNTFAPIIDYCVKKISDSRKNKANDSKKGAEVNG